MTLPSQPADLVQAVQAVQAASADYFDPDVDDLSEHVEELTRVVHNCEATLRATFSTKELGRLTRILVDMHADPLAGVDVPLYAFLGDL